MSLLWGFLYKLWLLNNNNNHNNNSIFCAPPLLQEINISNQVALAAKNNSSEFKNRIERMINSNNKNVSPKMGLIVILLISLMASSAFVGKAEKPRIEKIEIKQDTKQDTLRFTSKEAMNAKVKELGFDGMKDKVVLLNGTQVRFVIDASESMKKADKMMEEVQSELMKDGILNENKQKITLMFQYSDVLNGKATLGDKYEKYKGILNRYFPSYDSFATTRVFRYKSEKE